MRFDPHDVDVNAPLVIICSWYNRFWTAAVDIIKGWSEDTRIL